MNIVPRTTKILANEGPSGGFFSPIPSAARPNVPSSVSRWHGFLVLPENRFAARAVRSVCRAVRGGKRPAANPLVLHGPPGTGKSYLLGAAATHLATAADGISARLVSVGDMARSPDDGLADRDLWACDLLALEDVQHLTDRTADAACDLIDRRAARRRATVATASGGPAGLTHLPRRLTSRLAAGLVVQLEPLSAASRRAILADAATAKGVRLTGDALARLAEQTSGGGVRTALGLLQNLAQVAKAFPGPLGRAEVEQILADAGQPTSAAPDVSVIVTCVASAFGVSAAELLGPSRLRRTLGPRQVAMYLARELTGLSFPRIGAAFGGRDHTTVIHAHRKVERELKSDLVLAKRLSELRGALG
jgi:chromosomal replication initiator protein